MRSSKYPAPAALKSAVREPVDAIIIADYPPTCRDPYLIDGQSFK